MRDIHSVNKTTAIINGRVDLLEDVMLQEDSIRILEYRSIDLEQVQRAIMRVNVNEVPKMV